MQRSTGEDGGMRKIQMMPTEEPSVEESQVEQAPAIAAEGESVANSERFLNNEPGHARMETVAQSMSQAKDAVVSRVKNTWGGVKGTLGKIGSFFSKENMKEAAAHALSTPEYVGKGVQAADDMIGKAEEGFASIQDSVTNKAAEISGRIGEKVDSAGQWAEASVASAAETVARAGAWTEVKATKAKDMAQAGLEIGAGLTLLAGAKTVEGVRDVGNKIASGYEASVDYGRNAVEAARVKAAEVKGVFRSFANRARMKLLEASMSKALSVCEKIQDQMKIVSNNS